MGGEQHSMPSLCPILGDGRKTRMLGVGRLEEGGRDEPTQGLTSLSKEFGLVSKVVGGRDTIGFAVHIYPSFA